MLGHGLDLDHDCAGPAVRRHVAIATADDDAVFALAMIAVLVFDRDGIAHRMASEAELGVVGALDGAGPGAEKSNAKKRRPAEGQRSTSNARAAAPQTLHRSQLPSSTADRPAIRNVQPTPTDPLPNPITLEMTESDLPCLR